MGDQAVLYKYEEQKKTDSIIDPTTTATLESTEPLTLTQQVKILVILLAFACSADALWADSELRAYLISDKAVSFIRYAYPESEMAAQKESRRSDSTADFTPSSHVFFARYDIRFGSEESSLTYDGHSLLIRETKENHEKISLILRVIEDTVRSSENQKTALGKAVK